MGRAGRAGCALCGQGRHRRRSVPSAVCATCHLLVCPRHARGVDGQTVCTRCLRDAPTEAQAQALRLS